MVDSEQPALQVIVLVSNPHLYPHFVFALQIRATGQGK